MPKSPVDATRLTQVVLGLLRYLPTGWWLPGLLAELHARNPDLAEALVGGTSPTVQLWPRFVVPAEWSSWLGRLPTARGAELPRRCVAPDAVIECSEWLVFVGTSADEEIDSARLFQDYVMASQAAGERPFFVVHVDMSLTRHLLAGTALRNPEPGGSDVRPEDGLEHYVAARYATSDAPTPDPSEVKRRLAWYGWAYIHRLLGRIQATAQTELEALPGPFSTVLHRLIDDAIALLELAGAVAPDLDIVSQISSLNIDASLIPRFGKAAIEASSNGPRPQPTKALARTAQTHPPEPAESASPTKPPDEPEPLADAVAPVGPPAEPSAPEGAETTREAPTDTEPKPVQAAAQTAGGQAAPASSVLDELTRLKVEPDSIAPFNSLKTP